MAFHGDTSEGTGRGGPWGCPPQPGPSGCRRAREGAPRAGALRLDSVELSAPDRQGPWPHPTGPGEVRPPLVNWTALCCLPRGRSEEPAAWEEPAPWKEEALTCARVVRGGGHSGGGELGEEPRDAQDAAIFSAKAEVICEPQGSSAGLCRCGRGRTSFHPPLSAPASLGQRTAPGMQPVSASVSQ